MDGAHVEEAFAGVEEEGVCCCYCFGVVEGEGEVGGGELVLFSFFF